MGCICSKGKSANEYVAENHRRELKAKRSSSSSKHLIVNNNNNNNNDATTHLISNTYRDSSDENENENENENNASEKVVSKRIITTTSTTTTTTTTSSVSVGVISKGFQIKSSLVVAGWPSWLTAVAGEAISGWIPRRADSFHKLDKASY